MVQVFVFPISLPDCEDKALILTSLPLLNTYVSSQGLAVGGSGPEAAE